MAVSKLNIFLKTVLLDINIIVTLISEANVLGLVIIISITFLLTVVEATRLISVQESADTSFHQQLAGLEKRLCD